VHAEPDRHEQGVRGNANVGRPRTAALRRIATERGWLEPSAVLPDGVTLAAVFESSKTARKRAERLVSEGRSLGRGYR